MLPLPTIGPADTVTVDETSRIVILQGSDAQRDGDTRPTTMPDTLQLQRFAYTPFGTFGRLYMPEFQCFTIERPWLNNVPKESCIPEGEYGIRRGFASKSLLVYK